MPDVLEEDRLRPLDQPLAWVGADRILLDDVSRFGLRRKVIARKGGMMDVEAWLKVIGEQWRVNSDQSAVSSEQLHCWLVERGEFWFLWIVWKERT